MTAPRPRIERKMPALTAVVSACRTAVPALTALMPALTVVVLFAAVPLGLLVRLSFMESPSGRGFYVPGSWTVDHWSRSAERDGLARIARTLWFAGCVSAGVIAVAYPTALALRFSFPVTRLIGLMLVLSPKTIGTTAVLFGLQRLLPRGWWGAVVTEIYFTAPYAVLVLLLQLQRIDDRWICAARGLGADWWDVFRRIVGPLSRPGLALVVPVTFAWGVAAFLGPLFLGGPEDATLAVEMHRQAFDYSAWPRAAVEGVTAAVAAMLVLIAPRWRRT